MEEDATQDVPEVPPTAPRKRGYPAGQPRVPKIPVEVLVERLPQVNLTKKQLKQLQGKGNEPPKPRTEAQIEAAKKGAERLRRWQAERKEEKKVSMVPLLSKPVPRKKKDTPAEAAPVPPSEPVSEESDSDPEVTETELSTTDAEAAGLGPARRRVTRPTKAAVKQLAVVNRALGSHALPGSAGSGPAPAPQAPPPPSPWASMLNTVWRPR